MSEWNNAFCAKHGDPHRNSAQDCTYCINLVCEETILKYFDITGIRFITAPGSYNIIQDEYVGFSFYLPNYNALVDYFGPEHYNHYDRANSNLERICFRDNLKAEWAAARHLRLVIVEYDDDIHAVLNAEFGRI